MLNLASRRILSVVGGLLLAFPYSVALAQSDTLKKWQNAVSYAQDDNQWCRSLMVLSGYESDCVSIQNEVNKSCKESGKLICSPLSPKSLLQQLERDEKEIERIGSERSKLDSVRSSSSSDESTRKAATEELSKLTDRQKELSQKNSDRRSELSRNKGEVKDRLKAADACVEYRQRANDLWKKAINQVERESDNDLKTVSTQLATIWKKRDAEHQRPIENAKVTRQNCIDILSSWP